MKKVVFVLLAIISTSIFAQDFQVPTEWKTLTGKNFTIRYPEQIISYQDKKADIELLLFFPKDENKSPFQENILLVTDNSLPKGVSLNFFTQTSLEELTRTIPEFSLKGETDLTINQVPFKRIVYTGKYDNENIVMTQYFTIVKNIVYILNYTSVPALYDDSKDLAEQIISTYTFTKKK